jgi:hypothetical protein
MEPAEQQHDQATAAELSPEAKQGLDVVLGLIDR